MSLQTSSEHPAPVRTVSTLIGTWVRRLGPVWVEGQLTSVRSRPGTRTAFLTLRDPDVEMSLTVTCPQELLDGLGGPRLDGARVVVHARPDFYPVRGTLSLAADAIRPVGLGELLARLEALKRVLAAEGLFEPERKRPLPFLPGTVGLVCGRESAAERDVVHNATRRWPAVRFEIRRVAVQGPTAVSEVVAALVELDARPEVDVIVVARGGGSVEDLLPFSAETLLRAVAQLHTPVVSAIGHETDSPLLDLVADVRASTPTDAARRIVPDLAEEQAGLARTRMRARAALVARLDREQHALDLLRTRPVLAQPQRWLQAHAVEIRGLADRARRAVRARLDRAVDDVTHLHARLLALSPAATLARGYAVLTRHDDDRVVRSPADAPQGTLLIARLAHGRIGATSVGSWDE